MMAQMLAGGEESRGLEPVGAVGLPPKAESPAYSREDLHGEPPVRGGQEHSAQARISLGSLIQEQRATSGRARADLSVNSS